MALAPNPRRRRLLVISQVYVPDPAAVGQHVADAAEAMAARGWDVVVYTSARGYDDPSARYRTREQRHGVEIRRLPLSSFGKRSIPVRLVAQFLFMLQATTWAFFSARFDLILVSTSPPFAGFFGAALSWVRRTPLVWWVMDVNPDQMVVAGKLSAQSVLVRIFDWMNRVTLRRASTVVTLDEFMSATLRHKLPRAVNLRVHPPWSHNHAIPGVDHQNNAFRRTHGLGDRFVVMYAGNHAIQHPLDTLLDAAHELEDDPRVVFVFVGGGAGKAGVEHRIGQGARNIVSLPYQPLQTLDEMLAAADVHVVSMGEGMVGIVHPCKIYGALVAARPVLAFGPEQSHIGRLVPGSGLGWRVDHGDVKATVAVLRAAVDMPPHDLREMGARAARLAADQFRAQQLISDFCDIACDSSG